VLFVWIQTSFLSLLSQSATNEPWLVHDCRDRLNVEHVPAEGESNCIISSREIRRRNVVALERWH
jgi:hypothetical protein